MTLSPEVSEGSICIHPEFGAGNLRFNDVSDGGIRVITIEFPEPHGFRWMKADEEYSDILPAPRTFGASVAEA
jgi:hypothetical protein